MMNDPWAFAHALYGIYFALIANQQVKKKILPVNIMKKFVYWLSESLNGMQKTQYVQCARLILSLYNPV